MKYFVLFFGLLIFTLQQAEAGILSDLFNNRTYHYQPPIQYRHYPQYNYYNNYTPYRHQRLYNNYYPRNYNYYNQQPIIYKTRVKRSENTNNEKQVSNNIKGLSKIENQVFFQSYEYDTPIKRIERLEQKIFGACQNGELEDRVNLLKNASKSYKSFNRNYMQDEYRDNLYSQYRPPIFTGTMGSSWRNNAWSNFKNQFVGMPTGLTPAMDPAYMDYFEADRMGSGEQFDIQTNRSYYKSNRHRGAGMGVTLLD